MDLQAYHDFTRRLQDNLESDPRVLGLVAVGSMAEQSRTPDAWSDHDFFVITVPGEQESFRQCLDWLPDPEQIVLSIRETAHGLKVFYAEGHLIEFAVFEESELTVARVNDYRILIDRTSVAPLIAQISQREPMPGPYDPHRDLSMVVALCFVGSGRYARGEHLSAHAFVKFYTLHHLLPLLAHLLGTVPSANTTQLDNLDSFRRFEFVFPEVGAAISRALLLPVPEAAIALLDIAEQYTRTAIADYPTQAVKMVRDYIQRATQV